MSQRLSFEQCRRVFELLHYYPDFVDENVYLTDGTARGPKGFVAFAAALESADSDVLRDWLVLYQGISPLDVQPAIDRVLGEGA